MIHDLDPTRWTVLSPYLDQALEMPSAARPAWVEGLRTHDPRLAAEVEELLAEYDQMEQEGFLERPPAPRATLEGQVLGPYTVRERIGQGGMGSVWLADRSDGRYEGVVAVKLLNASLIGQEAEERFRREGSILARLRHPHIAHLIDAGVSPAGPAVPGARARRRRAHRRLLRRARAGRRGARCGSSWTCWPRSRTRTRT